MLPNNLLYHVHHMANFWTLWYYCIRDDIHVFMYVCVSECEIDRWDHFPYKLRSYRYRNIGRTQIRKKNLVLFITQVLIVTQFFKLMSVIIICYWYHQ